MRTDASRGHHRPAEAIPRPSEAIRGNLPSGAIRGHQRPTSAPCVAGNQRSSGAIRGHQRPSGAIRGHRTMRSSGNHRSSGAIRGHHGQLTRRTMRSSGNQRSSGAIRGHQGQLTRRTMRSSGIVTATLASSEPTPKAESSRSLANEVKAESGVRRYEKTLMRGSVKLANRSA